MEDTRCAQDFSLNIQPLISNGKATALATSDSPRNQIFRQANGCAYTCRNSPEKDSNIFLDFTDSTFYTDTTVTSDESKQRDNNCRFLKEFGHDLMEGTSLGGNNHSGHHKEELDNLLGADAHLNACIKDGSRSNGVHVQFETPRHRSPVISQTGIDLAFSAHKRNCAPRKLSKILSRFHKNTSQSDGILPDLKKIRRRWRSSSSTSFGSNSTSTSETRGTEFERTAPDGGWGWVVVFASFMVHCIADGVTMSFGVLYIEFLSFFQESKALTSWIGSLFMAIPLLAGPLASFVTDKYGCRLVTIWGSVIACIGFILSAFANSVAVLFITIGLITGIGLALCYVAAIVIVAFYFEKKRSLATGIAVAGSGIGTFVFAPLIHHLIQHYKWRGCLIILAGAFLNMAVCGSLMRDLQWTRKKSEKSRARTRSVSSDVFQSSIGGMPSPTQIKRIIQMGNAESLLCSDETPSNIVRSSSLVMLPTFLKKSHRIPNDILAQFSKTNTYEIISQVYPDYLTHSASGSLNPLDGTDCRNHPTVSMSKRKKLKVQLSLHKDEPISQFRRTSSCFEHLSDKNDNITTDFKPMIIESSTKNGICKNRIKYSTEDKRAGLTSIPEDVLRIKRQSMTFRGAVFNIHRYRLRSSSCPNIYKNSALPRKDTKKQNAWQFLRTYWEEVKSYFTIKRCCKLDFLTFAASNFILYVFYDTVYLYLSDYAQGMGMTPDESAGLIAFIGILNCIGMIIMGYVGDQEWSSPLILYLFSMVFCGASVVLMPFLQSYAALASAAAIFGLFISANYALTSVILVELTSLDGFGKAYGLILLIQGIANLIGPPFVGMLADTTGSYAVPFVVSGTFIIFCGLMLSIIPAVQRYGAASGCMEEFEDSCDV